MKQTFKNIKRQAGISLMEVIAALLIIGLVVAGALALFNSADSSQKSNQMLHDIVALRSAVKGLYTGQGNYSTNNLNGILKAAKKIPSDLAVDNAAPPVITHPMNGTITITGATSSYNMVVTNIPTDVCVSLLTNSGNGWVSVQVGGATALTAFPITPATASSAANCAASDSNTITFVGA